MQTGMKNRKSYGLDRVGLVITKSEDGYKVTTTPFTRDNIVDLGQELVQGGQTDTMGEGKTGTVAVAHLTTDGSFDNKGFKPEGSREVREALEVYLEAMNRHLERAETFETVAAFTKQATSIMVRDNIDPATKTFKPVCCHCQDDGFSIMGAFSALGVRVITTGGSGLALDLSKDEVLIPGADCILPGDYQADYNAAALAKFQADLPAAMTTALEFYEEMARKLNANLAAARNRLLANSDPGSRGKLYPGSDIVGTGDGQPTGLGRDAPVRGERDSLRKDGQARR